MILLVYHSITGNTKTLAEWIEIELRTAGLAVEKYALEDVPPQRLQEADSLILGTYTWGNGEMPDQLQHFTEKIYGALNENLVTGAFGTGDSFYPYFCGAVDRLKDIFFEKTDLAVTMKVELLPQPDDHVKCSKFAELIKNRMINNKQKQGTALN
ncbi:flavodoxin domain-containing protein [Alkalicoccus halolimnae]|uniref:Flavodoxin domain-containing protein n=1 Tax=Alkalicoccus halolimnae TaxID=1667239 RepID=A0AAJ8N2Y4_9BACI|nr:flavodoxin domain-containing protein [Alkalicoccus halolimnae]